MIKPTYIIPIIPTLYTYTSIPNMPKHNILKHINYIILY